MACLNFKVERIYLDLNIEILQLSQKPESILQQVCPDPLLCNSNFLLGRSQILCWGTMNVLNGSPDCAIFCFVGRQLLYVESHWLIKKIIKFYFENSAFTVFINRFFFQLLLIDEGETITRQKNNFDFWKLPEELRENLFPRHVAEIIVANLKPNGNAKFLFCIVITFVYSIGFRPEIRFRFKKWCLSPLAQFCAP